MLLDASQSSDIDGMIMAWSWDFDNDGTVDLTTDEPIAEWTPTYGGLVTVALIVTDNKNGQTRVEKTVQVKGFEVDSWLLF